MKVLLHYPEWGNRWIGYFNDILGNKYDLKVHHDLNGESLGPLSEEADILISMWCNEAVYFWTNFFPDKKIITYLRRYELWRPELMAEIRFQAVNAMIFVNDYYRKTFNDLKKNAYPEMKQYVIHNGVDLSAFPFREKPAGTKKIAFVCAIKDVKNYPLAFQILLNLPEEYKIHNINISGDTYIVPQLLSYRESLGLQDRFITEWRVEPEDVPNWLMDKDYILSTSVNEGNPMNVIEAMAMGIKPVVHCWPGAETQFPESSLFAAIQEAVHIIESPVYSSGFYRGWVEKNFTFSNYEKILDVIKDVCAT